MQRCRGADVCVHEETIRTCRAGEPTESLAIPKAAAALVPRQRIPDVERQKDLHARLMQLCHEPPETPAERREEVELVAPVNPQI